MLHFVVCYSCVWFNVLNLKTGFFLIVYAHVNINHASSLQIIWNLVQYSFTLFLMLSSCFNFQLILMSKFTSFHLCDQIC